MLKKLLLDKSNSGLVQLIRYGMVLFIAAPIDLGGYILLKSVFDFPAVLAAAVSFTVSLLANYVLSVKWVWTDHTNRQKHIDALIFFLIGAVGLGLTSFLVWLFVHPFGMNFILAKLLTFVVVFFWSFGARRFLFTGILLKSK